MKVWIASSSMVRKEKYLNIAEEVAKIFVDEGFDLVCGGISNSMMKEVYSVYHKNNIDPICITLECYQENLSGSCNLKIVKSTFDRTKELYSLADIIVFLPGGTGTLSELFSSLEEHRTTYNKKRLILLNHDGFYDCIIEMIRKQVTCGFNIENILEHIEIVETIEELKKKVSDKNE